jgi:hypothetical protein
VKGKKTLRTIINELEISSENKFGIRCNIKYQKEEENSLPVRKLSGNLFQLTKE